MAGRNEKKKIMKLKEKRKKKNWCTNLIWATAQLYCDRRNCIVTQWDGRLVWMENCIAIGEVYCNLSVQWVNCIARRLLYCGWKVAWPRRGVVSRYNFCIVTEAARLG